MTLEGSVAEMSGISSDTTFLTFLSSSDSLVSITKIHILK